MQHHLCQLQRDEHLCAEFTTHLPLICSSRPQAKGNAKVLC
jgi:hypothetical protein